jgi:hypothetical protein
VVGQVERTHAGNVALRIGTENPTGTWSQVAHVVLTPGETLDLIARLHAELGGER